MSLSETPKATFCYCSIFSTGKRLSSATWDGGSIYLETGSSSDIMLLRTRIITAKPMHEAVTNLLENNTFIRMSFTTVTSKQELAKSEEHLKQLALSY